MQLYVNRYITELIDFGFIYYLPSCAITCCPHAQVNLWNHKSQSNRFAIVYIKIIDDYFFNLSIQIAVLVGRRDKDVCWNFSLELSESGLELHFVFTIAGWKFHRRPPINHKYLSFILLNYRFYKESMMLH